jgi:hypothetical protein
MDNPLNGYLYCYGQLDGPLWADMAGWWLGLTFEMSPLYIKRTMVYSRVKQENRSFIVLWSLFGGRLSRSILPIIPPY